MGSLHGPAPSGLDGCGGALVGDLAGKAQAGQGLAGRTAVVSGVQVAGALIWEHAAELVRSGLQGGGQQRGVVPVGARAGDAQRDAVVLGGHRAFQAALAPVHRGRPSALAAAGRLGDAPIHRHVGKLQADDLVIGRQGQGVHLLADAQRRPRLQPAADRAVRAPRRSDPLIPTAMHQRGNHVLKHHPVGDPAAMAAQRVSRIKVRALAAQEGAEPGPDRLQQA